MIQLDYIRTYCLGRFKTNYRLSGDYTELIIPSIFIEGDGKRHMSINLESGLWRCFKTGNRGNFIKLYAALEGCSYKKAYEKFLFEDFLHETKSEVPPETRIESLEDTSTFEKLEPTRLYGDLVCASASELIVSREMHEFDFYLALDGFYKDRLIIPFFDSNRKLFYFQARAILPDHQPKYLNCKAIKSSHILYPFDYDSWNPLYITEGVFDCLTLKKCGLNATTTLSCNTSSEQMEQLKCYNGPLVAAFDTDAAGIHGRNQFLSMAYRHKRRDLMYAIPGLHKDWNELLVRSGKASVESQAKDLKSLDRLSLFASEL